MRVPCFYLFVRVRLRIFVYAIVTTVRCFSDWDNCVHEPKVIYTLTTYTYVQHVRLNRVDVNHCWTWLFACCSTFLLVLFSTVAGCSGNVRVWVSTEIAVWPVCCWCVQKSECFVLDNEIEYILRRVELYIETYSTPDTYPVLLAIIWRRSLLPYITSVRVAVSCEIVRAARRKSRAPRAAHHNRYCVCLCTCKCLLLNECVCVCYLRYSRHNPKRYTRAVGISLGQRQSYTAHRIVRQAEAAQHRQTQHQQQQRQCDAQPQKTGSRMRQINVEVCVCRVRLRRAPRARIHHIHVPPVQLVAVCAHFIVYKSRKVIQVRRKYSGFIRNKWTWRFY